MFLLQPAVCVRRCTYNHIYNKKSPINNSVTSINIAHTTFALNIMEEYKKIMLYKT